MRGEVPVERGWQTLSRSERRCHMTFDNMMSQVMKEGRRKIPRRCHMTFDNRMPPAMKEGRRKVPILGIDVVRLK